MYRIVDGRGTGKTSRLMLLAKESGATIVCSNPRAMEQKAHAYGITGLSFISYGEFTPERRAGGSGCYLVDELEAFLVIFTVITRLWDIQLVKNNGYSSYFK